MSCQFGTSAKFWSVGVTQVSTDIPMSYPYWPGSARMKARSSWRYCSDTLT